MIVSMQLAGMPSHPIREERSITEASYAPVALSAMGRKRAFGPMTARPNTNTSTRHAGSGQCDYRS